MLVRPIPAVAMAAVPARFGPFYLNKSNKVSHFEQHARNQGGL